MTESSSALRNPERVALVGLGTVGCGWAAAYLAAGYTVVATDGAPEAERKCRTFLDRAWPALRKLGIAAFEAPPHDRLKVVPEIAAAATGSGIVHENAPENLALKRQLFAEIEAAAPREAIVASSTGGLPPSDLQAEMANPERFVVVHPFNPPYLVPLVEVIGGRRTHGSVVDAAIERMRRLGKHPIRIDKEATGFLTNRLQFALLREAVNCAVEGIASPQAIEDAVRFGLGPRWAVMGSLMTLTLSGGSDGMSAVMERFGPAIETWWAALGSPSLTPEVKSRLIACAEEITRSRSLSEWEAWRDARLVEVLEAQKIE